MKLPGTTYRFWIVMTGLAVLPFVAGFDDYRVSVLTGALLIGMLGQAWGLMARCGLISLGHAAFFGIGAYGAAVSRVSGIPLLPALVVGGLLALVFSTAFIGLSERLAGAYFALATLVTAVVPKALALNWPEVTGGEEGLLGVPPLGRVSVFGADIDFSHNRVFEYYLLFFVVLCLGTVTWWLLNRSRFGMASAALSHDETASRSLGIRPVTYRAAAVMTSAIFTGIGGGFYAFQVGYLEPHYIFSLHFSVVPLVVAIFGGLTTSWGPLIGALIIHTLDEFIFRKFFMTSHEILYGLTLTMAVILFPRGVFKALMKIVGEEKIAYH